MRTVERRSCSAISPNPGMAPLALLAMLVRSVRAFANNNAGFLKRAAANEFQGQRFADGFRAKLPVNIFEPRDRVARERHKNVAYDNPSFMRWPFRFDFENDGRGLVVALQRFSQRIGQTHRLQTDAKVTARNPAFLQKRVHDAIHRGRGNGDGSKARETRRRDSDDTTARVHHGASNSRGLQADVEPNVGRKRSAGPTTPLGDNQADSAKRSHRTAGACASDNQCEAAGLDCGSLASFCDG